MGTFQQDNSITYNERGDVVGTVMIRSGSLDPRQHDVDNERLETRYLYQYDSHGNWTEKTDIKFGRSSSPATRRKLTYY
jgi:YD repeat-containing protein